MTEFTLMPRFCQRRLKIPQIAGVKIPPSAGLGNSLRDAGRSRAQRRFAARFGRSGGRGDGGGVRPTGLLLPSPDESGSPPFLQAIAFSANVDRRRMVQQPVQDRRSNDRVPEDAAPFPIALVTGQDDAASFVARTD